MDHDFAIDSHESFGLYCAAGLEKTGYLPEPTVLDLRSLVFSTADCSLTGVMSLLDA